MKTLKVWGICEIEAPIFAVSAVQPWNAVDMLFLLERKNSWLMVPLQISALELSLDFVLHFQRQVSRYYLVLGFRLYHFDCMSEALLDKVSMTNRLLHVDCPKRVPMYQTNSMYQIANFGCGSASHKDLEDWERGVFSTANRFYILKNSLESLKEFILSCKFCVCEVSSTKVA